MRKRTQLFGTVLQATSPDEKAFVEAAAANGIVFTGYTTGEGENGIRCYQLEFRESALNSGLELDEIVQVQYQLDAIIPFSSDRMRMTVMARHPDGTYHIHSKGAEHVILDPEVRRPCLSLIL